MDIKFTCDENSYHLDSWNLPSNQVISYTPEVQGFPIGDPIWFDRGITNEQPEDRLRMNVGNPIWFEKNQSFTPTEYANFVLYCLTCGITCDIV